MPMVLNVHPGSKLEVTFPVLARSSFGIGGDDVPSLMQIPVACVWIGIHECIEGPVMYLLLSTVSKPLWWHVPNPLLISHCLV